jgi:hypothetical protein
MVSMVFITIVIIAMVPPGAVDWAWSADGYKAELNQLPSSANPAHSTGPLGPATSREFLHQGTAP